MRILIDIIHPAHVHFFRNPIRLLRDAGHTVSITSRAKDCTLALLDRLGFDHQCISEHSGGTMLGMGRELIVRNRALAAIARDFRPHVVTGLGGICAAQVGRWIGIPSVVFYDTENARLQNLLTFPLASTVVVPECFGGWAPRRKTVRYRGYHELSYLHPDYFSPNRDIALANGLAPDGDTYFVRVVSWQANHDLGVQGWSAALLGEVVGHLAARGRVVISAEGTLPADLEQYRFDGDTEQVHHLLAHCRAYIGESATMASEAAVLGVPAVYAATVSRGYVDEQERRYGLAKVVGIASGRAVSDAVEQLLAVPKEEITRRHRKLQEETVDVARFAVSMLTQA